jgi:hypothetical protein
VVGVVEKSLLDYGGLIDKQPNKFSKLDFVTFPWWVKGWLILETIATN